MTNQEKIQKIKELQAKKRELYPALKDTTAIKNSIFKAYNQAKHNWMILRDQYEALDREEKLLSFKLQGSKTLIPKSKKSKDSAKSKALAALKALPLELREQVLTSFK